MLFSGACPLSAVDQLAALESKTTRGCSPVNKAPGQADVYTERNYRPDRPKGDLVGPSLLQRPRTTFPHSPLRSELQSLSLTQISNGNAESSSDGALHRFGHRELGSLNAPSRAQRRRRSACPVRLGGSVRDDRLYLRDCALPVFRWGRRLGFRSGIKRFRRNRQRTGDHAAVAMFATPARRGRGR